MWRSVLVVGSILASAPDNAVYSQQQKTGADQTEIPAAQPRDYYSPCTRENENRHSDLCAQWQAVDWARRNFWTALATVIGLVITLMFNLEAWRHARKGETDTKDALKAAQDLAATAAETLEHAREATGAQLRPWLALHTVLTSGLGPRENWQFTLSIQLANVGNVPATNVYTRVWADVTHIRPDDERLNDELLLRRTEAGMRWGGNLIVPKEPLGLQVSTNFQISEMERNFIESRKGMFCPSITVACFYKSAQGEDETIRYTMKTYNFVPPGGGGTWIDFNREYAEGHLTIVPTSGNTNKAT